LIILHPLPEDSDEEMREINETYGSPDGYNDAAFSEKPDIRVGRSTTPKKRRGPYYTGANPCGFSTPPCDGLPKPYYF